MASDFSIQFGEILEKPAILPGEQGKVNVTVTNQGDAPINGPVDLKLYASTDKELDTNNLNTLGSPTGERGAEDPLEGTDELLGTLENRVFDLAPGESETLTIDFGSSDFRNPSVVSPGAYYLIGEVVPDSASGDTNASNNTDSQLITQGDVVIQWNSILLNAIQTSGKDGASGTAPPLAARNQAIVHTAIYDAVNDLPEGASVEAAVVGAAYQTLYQLFTDENLNPDLKPELRAELRAELNSQRDRSLTDINGSSAAEDAGFNFGVEVANQILAERRTDFSNRAQGVSYTPGNDPGDFQLIDGKEPLLPGWGRVTPFAIDSVSQFRPDGPPEFGSPDYANDIDEVRLKGGFENTDKTTLTRTEDETEIAQFWAYDRADTFRPPGQWNQIAQEVALAEGNTLAENARLFAQLNIAMADAGIVTWDGKYIYEQLRPITAIRNADTDNNPNTAADPEWESLLDTPPFPDYISGHATFGGAAAQVLANFFGDDTGFNLTSQELPGEYRSYGSFTQAAEENADSRLFGGVHVPLANADGVEIGQNVGDFVFNNALT